MIVLLAVSYNCAVKRTKATKHPSLDEVIRILREHLPELRERWDVKTLGIFGSSVHGEAGPWSDLDILVEFENAPSFFEFVELEDHLGDLLGVRVDLVMKTALRPEIGRRILEEAISL